jgi:hypothetical protein
MSGLKFRRKGKSAVMATIQSCPFYGSDAACSVIYSCVPNEKLGKPALQSRRIPVDNQMTRI